MKVLIADDNAAMRAQIVRLLEPTFEVVGQVSDGCQFVEAELHSGAQIGIVDISMPGMNGIEAVQEIKSRGSLMKIVYLTVHEDPDFVEAAFKSGAVGYVVKKGMATDLLQALNEVLDGKTYVSPCCYLS
jgi:DNA-binding NarL/FixJ family response regulator